ncbi:MAG: IclR family transcriptional regulator [Acetobacteraceae bacterium]
MGNGVAVVEPEADEDSGPHGVLARTLAIIELLAHNARGLALFEIADRLRIPRSAAHRLLTSLAGRGYVRAEARPGLYVLTAKIASLGFIFLAGSGVTDLAQPILDRLARESGELVRMTVLDDNRLTWVARAQGAGAGLRYDPDMGQVARLSCSATGLAWLSCLTDGAALALVEAEGLGTREAYGPRAPQTPQAFLRALRLARKRGFSIMVQAFAPGMAAMAAPIRNAATNEPTGTVSIAGPHPRFNEQRMQQLGPKLLEASRELSLATVASPGWSSRRADIFTA